MSNETLCTNALAHARSALKPNKPANKSSKSGTDRQWQAVKVLDRMQQAYKQTTTDKSKPFPQRYSPFILSLDPSDRAGNCTEYAALACAHVLDNGGLGSMFALLEADHVACLVGDSEARDEFTSWQDFPNDVWVCDPWANIACRAIEYGDAFAAKIKKWYAAGKAIMETGVDEISSDKRDRLVEALKTGRKKVIRM